MLLQDLIIEEHIKSALKEDIGFGDITTDFLAEEKDVLSGCLNSRSNGVLCGCAIFEKVFKILGNVEIDFYFKDGDFIAKGDKIASISGSARSILTGERTALNYIQRLSGIATETKKYQLFMRHAWRGTVDERDLFSCVKKKTYRPNQDRSSNTT